MHKLCGGKVPVFHTDLMDDTDKELIQHIQQIAKKVEGLLEEYKFRDALFEVIDLARKGNQYLQKKEPWIVAKSLIPGPSTSGKEARQPQKEIDNCLHICLQLTANLAILINPFLPFTAKKMLHMMKVVDKMLEWDNAGKIKLLSAGYSLRAPELLFRKIEDWEIEVQLEKLKSKSLPNLSRGGALAASISKIVSNNVVAGSPIPLWGGGGAKPEIVFDDFAKIDLRTGTIIAAEKVEKADKLLKLSVDLGFETRTIVSGIALHFKPEDIVGKQVTVVVNLAPRKMRGIESNGMILMAEDKSGKLHFINPDNKIDEGSRVS